MRMTSPPGAASWQAADGDEPSVCHREHAIHDRRHGRSPPTMRAESRSAGAFAALRHRPRTGGDMAQVALRASHLRPGPRAANGSRLSPRICGNTGGPASSSLARQQPPIVHALAHAMNHALGNVGTHRGLHRPSRRSRSTTWRRCASWSQTWRQARWTCSSSSVATRSTPPRRICTSPQHLRR